MAELLDYLPLAAAIMLIAAGVGWLRRRSKASGQPPNARADADGERDAFIDTVPAITAGAVEDAARIASGDGVSGDNVSGGEPVTVATYSLPEWAHLGRLLLEGHGIPAFVADENLIATDWLYANAIGGVKLQVPRRHAAEATLLLTEARGRSRGVMEESSPETAVATADVEAAGLRCPSCGSDEVYAVHTGRKLAYATLLLLNFPVSWLSRSYECDRCGRRWSG